MNAITFLTTILSILFVSCSTIKVDTASNRLEITDSNAASAIQAGLKTYNFYLNEGIFIQEKLNEIRSTYTGDFEFTKTLECPISGVAILTASRKNSIYSRSTHLQNCSTDNAVMSGTKQYSATVSESKLYVAEYAIKNLSITSDQTKAFIVDGKGYIQSDLSTDTIEVFSWEILFKSSELDNGLVHMLVHSSPDSGNASYSIQGANDSKAVLVETNDSQLLSINGAVPESVRLELLYE